MDNNYPQQPDYSNQQSQSVLNNQPAGAYSKNRLNPKTVGIIVAGLLLLGLILYLVYSLVFAKNYSLTVEGQEVPSSELKQAYDYYKSLEDFNEADTFNFIRNLYAENYILKQEYTGQGYNLDSLLELVEVDMSSDVPAPLMRVINENSRLKAALIPTLGIKQRSGEVYRISVRGLDDGETASLEPMLLQKLDQYSAQIESGSASAQVASLFNNDTELQSQDAVDTAVLIFEDMSPSRPIMPGETFVESVFSTAAGETSSPFIVRVGDIVMYSFVYVTDTTTGEYDSYQVWLREKINGLQIESNF